MPTPAVRLSLALLATLALPPTAAPAGPAPPRLELLLEASLPAEAGVGADSVAEDPFDRSFRMSRDLIAQGDGAVAGPHLRGAVRWSQLGRRHPAAPYARFHLTGTVETDDGAEIFFRVVGTSDGGESTASGRSALIGSGHFEVDLDPQYQWLNGITALWVGRYDPPSETFHYQAWAAAEAVAAARAHPRSP